MTYIAARAGYNYISLRPISMRLPGEPHYGLADNKELRKQTKAALAATGVRVHDVELARIYDDLDVKGYLPEIEVAAELGAHAVLGSIWTDDRACHVEQFAELCDLARPFGMTVDLEFVASSSVRNLAGVVDVLRTVERENAGLLLDMVHFHLSRDNPDDLDALPCEWFHFAHICDAPAV